MTDVNNTVRVLARPNTDFIVGKDNFEDVEINRAENIRGFYYFTNRKKGLIKRFVLGATAQTETVCEVTLIKNQDELFEPRFEYSIRDTTTKAIQEVSIPIQEGEDRIVRARVSLDNCHKSYDALLSFLRGLPEVDFAAIKYAVVTSDEKKLLKEALETLPKEDVVIAVAEKFGHGITEKDVAVITGRKNALERFKMLLDDKTYLERYQKFLEGKKKSHRPEDVWQHFFENNRWIFGYGLQLVSAEGLDDRKLETIVVGADIFDGAGKRIDGLMKTRGVISRSLFVEIKRADTQLLEPYDRPGVFVPAENLRGGVAQMQKTIHKVTLKVNKSLQEIMNKDGSPTGERIGFVQPRGVVVIGRLAQFEAEHGINEEMLASFELYRQQLHGVEVLTFDELYERAKYIVENL